MSPKPARKQAPTKKAARKKAAAKPAAKRARKKAGRPMIELTDEQVGQVSKLASVLSVGQMCDLFAISERTWNRICERRPDILAAYKSGKSRAVATVASGLLQQAQKGNVASAIFYLKTQAGWRETTRVEAVGDGGGPIQHEHYLLDHSRLTAEARRAILEATGRKPGPAGGQGDQGGSTT